jgi:2-haloacid dehalogenase
LLGAVALSWSAAAGRRALHTVKVAESPPAALLFDVFGTLVDWRSGVIDALRAFGARQGVAADWAAFADDWRGAYAPSLERVRSGAIGWQNLDALHRMSLDALLDRYAIAGVAETERRKLVYAWHALPAWPDTVAGLERLRTRYVIASLSNGNVALQVDLRRHAGLPFDMLFSAELFGHYKPDPQTYRGACALLDLAPQRVMLVAAHPSDLGAARSCGLSTAFVARPLEHGPREAGAAPDSVPEGTFAFAVDSIIALAAALGA